MVVDLAAIRKRAQELSGNRTSSVQLWKPEPGEHKVRGLPTKYAKEGMPFVELWFYYIGKNRGILAPNQFGKADPINELIRKLYSTNKPDDRLLAKKLQPKLRTFMPLIVRGDSSSDVMWWSFGKPVYQRLLSFYDDEDVGDILDVNAGFDLKVNIVPNGRMFNNKPSYDTTIDAARKASPVLNDPEKAKQLVDSVPNINDLYELKSYKEIETILNDWLNGGSDESQDEGSERGDKGDDFEKIVNEVKSASPKKDEEPKSTKKPPTSKKSAADELDDVEVAPKSSSKKTLDQAFEELEADMD